MTTNEDENLISLHKLAKEERLISFSEFNDGITDAQHIKRSPFASANLHKEHGGLNYKNAAWKGFKSWIAIRDENGTQLSSHSMKKLKKISCCSDLWHFDHQFWFELTGLSNENAKFEAIWIITKPGDLIVGSGEWYHHALLSTIVSVTAMDCAHDDEEH